VAEGPLRYLGMQVGRRMAVVRLPGGELLLHSVAPLTAELREALDGLGAVRYVVPASSLHGHLYMEQYAEAYPQAELFAAPGLEGRREDLSFAGELGDEPDSRWAGEVDQAYLRGHRFLTEVLLLHRASRTLLVGDAVWNVGPWFGPGARLWAGWRPGARPTPVFKRGINDREAAAQSVRRVLEWDFDRIAVGHGAMVQSGGREAFRAAYEWLL
jgi:hypothetical protein